MRTNIFLLCLILLCTTLFAQEEVKIKDGRTIIINNNGTWKYKRNTSKTDKKEPIIKNEIGSQFIGQWANIDPYGNGCGPDCPTSLNIYKDGKLFIIDESKWSSNGRSGGIVTKQKAYTATYKDESLEISDGFGMKIDYGTSSGHIFFNKKEFSKVVN